MAKVETFTYDLGAGWKLVQSVTNEGNEAFVFTNGKECITLLNDSVKQLRHLLQNQ
jgi:hypothetical protein